ncbi:hypothetical protein AB4037_31250 [Labrys sp. KB_33_2]|uniref:hypothetical protein n=1 Tax=Labrys sp. KB_33_2 TaxID=3237479 RepID=UPI003F8E8D0D
MRDLDRYEIELVSGAGYFTGGSIFDAMGNVIEGIAIGADKTANAATLGLFPSVFAAAFGVGKVLTVSTVNLGNSLLKGLFGIPTNQYLVTPYSNDIPH